MLSEVACMTISELPSYRTQADGRFRKMPTVRHELAEIQYQCMIDKATAKTEAFSSFDISGLLLSCPLCALVG